MHCMLMDLLHGFEVLSTTEETLFNSQNKINVFCNQPIFIWSLTHNILEFPLPCEIAPNKSSFSALCLRKFKHFLIYITSRVTSCGQGTMLVFLHHIDVITALSMHVRRYLKVIPLLHRYSCLLSFFFACGVRSLSILNALCHVKWLHFHILNSMSHKLSQIRN